MQSRVASLVELLKHHLPVRRVFNFGVTFLSEFLPVCDEGAYVKPDFLVPSQGKPITLISKDCSHSIIR